MIDKKKLEICAQNVVRCANIKKGECIFIKGGTHSQYFLEEIALNVLKGGGLPYIESTSDRFKEFYFNYADISVETLKKTPHHIIGLVQNIDKYIMVETIEDPAIRTQALSERMLAWNEGRRTISDILFGRTSDTSPGKEWIYVGYPTPQAAKFYGITYQDLERSIIDSILVSPEEINEIAMGIMGTLKGAEKIHVSDDYGTDFWVSVIDRNPHLEDGLLTDEKISANLMGYNLPAGEIYFAVKELKGEGKLFCPITRESSSYTIIKNLTLEFKEGKLDVNKISADNDIDKMVSFFRRKEEYDKKQNYDRLRTYNVAELGIGCNPEIKKAIGYILADEKLMGSIHLAFGSNNHMGGTSQSSLHWDFVSAPSINITVEYSDGKTAVVCEKGKFINS